MFIYNTKYGTSIYFSPFSMNIKLVIVIKYSCLMAILLVIGYIKISVLPILLLGKVCGNIYNSVFIIFINFVTDEILTRTVVVPCRIYPSILSCCISRPKRLGKIQRIKHILVEEVRTLSLYSWRDTRVFLEEDLPSVVFG